MYEDNGDYKMRINWKDIIIKIALVILFILLLIWLFPKADLGAINDSVYINNVNSMKEAAKAYYTKDRLPQSVGESTSMTLKQMFDNKMLIRFTDKDNNYCDETSSKVEVTKTASDKYVLRVQLHCGEQKDYILETIGCNDVCEGSNCVGTVIPDDSNNGDNNNNDTTPSNPDDSTDSKFEGIVKVTYYQHRKASYTTKTDYFCYDDGYILDGTKCKRLTDIVIDATPVKGNSSYTCPDGYTLNGSYCIKYTNAIEVVGNTSYECPNGYTLSGKSCIQTYDATYVAGATTYTCPNGGTLNGTQCVITVTGTPQINYTCPNGYTQNGNSCYTYVPAQQSTSTSTTTSDKCPAGYSPNGANCIKVTQVPVNNGVPKKTYGKWTLKKSTYSSVANQAKTTETEKLVLNGAVSGALCGDPCGNKGVWYEYSYYTRTVNTTYTCPAGYTGGGKTATCYTTVTDTKPYLTQTNTITNYTCPNGTLEENKCRITIAGTPTTTYICPSGYSGGGNSSVCTYSYDRVENKGTGTYSCPNGGTLNGNKCTITIDATVKSDDVTYTCPSGYTLNGKTCELMKDAQKVENITYTCPDSSYTLNGNKCIKKADEKPANTATTTSVSYQYQWSTSISIEGWEFTGKTKTENKYTAGQK